MGVSAPCIPKNRKASKNVSEHRKIRKPLMEKRRRERINKCLTSLAVMLFDIETPITDSTDGASSSSKRKARFEKADILEKTVKHWHMLDEKKEKELSSGGNCDKVSDSPNEPPNSFELGYQSCASLVDSLLKEWEEKDTNIFFRNDLNKHLNKRLKILSETGNNSYCENSDINREEDKDINLEEIPQMDMEEKITFAPQLLPDGTFALVVKGKSIDDTYLSKQNSSLYISCNRPASNDREAIDQPDHQRQMNFRAENNILNGENFVRFAHAAEIWRPWG